MFCFLLYHARLSAIQDKLHTALMVKQLQISPKMDRKPETPNLLLVTERKVLVKQHKAVRSPVWENKKRL